MDKMKEAAANKWQDWIADHRALDPCELGGLEAEERKPWPSASDVGGAIAEGLGLDPKCITKIKLEIDATDPIARITITMPLSNISLDDWRTWIEVLPATLVIQKTEEEPLPGVEWSDRLGCLVDLAGHPIPRRPQRLDPEPSGHIEYDVPDEEDGEVEWWRELLPDADAGKNSIGLMYGWLTPDIIQDNPPRHFLVAFFRWLGRALGRTGARREDMAGDGRRRGGATESRAIGGKAKDI